MYLVFIAISDTEVLKPLESPNKDKGVSCYAEWIDAFKEGAALVARGTYLVIRELERAVPPPSSWEGRSTRVPLNHRWPMI